MEERSAKKIVGGTIIYYKLKPGERPTNSEKLWKGRVKKFIPVSSNLDLSVVIVEVLEEGYEGEKEYIIAEQVVRIEEEKKEEQPM